MSRIVAAKRAWATMRGGAPADAQSLWISSDGDLTGILPAGADGPWLEDEGDVSSCRCSSERR